MSTGKRSHLNETEDVATTNEGEPASKIQKTSSSSSPWNPLIDCIEHVFQFLTIEELCEMERVNKNFCELIRSSSSIYKRQRFNLTDTYNVPKIHKILEKYGGFIRDLRFSPESGTIQLVSQHCKHLSTIHLLHHVTTTQLVDFLSQYASTLRELMFNLKSKETITSVDVMALQFPRLKKLSIGASSDKDVITFLDKAPSLQSLRVHCCTPELVEYIHKNVPTLRDFHYVERQLAEKSIDKPITTLVHLPLRLEEMTIVSSHLNAKDVTVIINTCPLLRKLAVSRGPTPPTIDHSTLASFGGNVHISAKSKTLNKLQIQFPLSISSFENIVAHCPNLKKLIVLTKEYACEVDDTSFNMLLRSCHLLEKVVIKGQNQIDGRCLLDEDLLSHKTLKQLVIKPKQYVGLKERFHVIREKKYKVNSVLEDLTISRVNEEDVSIILKLYLALHKLHIASDQLTTEIFALLTQQAQIQNIHLSKTSSAILSVPTIHYNPFVKSFRLDNDQSLGLMSFLAMRMAMPSVQWQRIPAAILTKYLRTQSTNSTADQEEVSVSNYELELFSLIDTILDKCKLTTANITQELASLRLYLPKELGPEQLPIQLLPSSTTAQEASTSSINVIETLESTIFLMKCLALVKKVISISKAEDVILLRKKVPKVSQESYNAALNIVSNNYPEDVTTILHPLLQRISEQHDHLDE